MHILTIMAAFIAAIGVATVYDAIIAKRWYHLLAGALTVALSCVVLAVRVALFGG